MNKHSVLIIGSAQERTAAKVLHSVLKDLLDVPVMEEPERAVASLNQLGQTCARNLAVLPREGGTADRPQLIDVFREVGREVGDVVARWEAVEIPEAHPDRLMFASDIQIINEAVALMRRLLGAALVLTPVML